ncbi:MAG: hypothetical protein V3T62_00380 [Alphaproteobacteria bacterium]
MLAENVPIGLFRFHIASEDFQASRAMAATKWIDRAISERQFDERQRNIRAAGMSRGDTLGMQRGGGPAARHCSPDAFFIRIGAAVNNAHSSSHVVRFKAVARNAGPGGLRRLQKVKEVG